MADCVNVNFCVLSLYLSSNLKLNPVNICWINIYHRLAYTCYTRAAHLAEVSFSDTPISPDFRHKRTKEKLWKHTRSNPGWVRANLAASTQDQAQPIDCAAFNGYEGGPGSENGRYLCR